MINNSISKKGEVKRRPQPQQKDDGRKRCKRNLFEVERMLTNESSPMKNFFFRLSQILKLIHELLLQSSRARLFHEGQIVKRLFDSESRYFNGVYNMQVPFFLPSSHFNKIYNP